MKTANRTKPKTDFGIEVRVFTAQTGMTVKELAERAGVKYTTLVETTTGRCAGHQLIPVVREFMHNYRMVGYLWQRRRRSTPPATCSISQTTS